MDTIYALQGSKTIIIIAHRLSTVSNCDWIYKMKNGRIVVEGSFDAVTNTEQLA